MNIDTFISCRGMSTQSLIQPELRARWCELKHTVRGWISFQKAIHANELYDEAVDSSSFAVFTNNKLEWKVNGTAFCAENPG